MNPTEQKIKEVQRQRRELREKVLAKMRLEPSMQLSATLSQIDDDILFWESQTDHSLEGIINTINLSMLRVLKK